MSNFFNKKIIKENFSRAAKNYSHFATIQKNVAQKTCLLALPFLQENNKILDLGSGSGFLGEYILNYKKKCQLYEYDLSYDMLKNSYKNHSLAIQGDIENLCFKSQSFDFLISSFALQWLEDFDKIFTNCYNILKSKGIFIFSIPNNNSLSELRKASDYSGCNFNFNNLPKTTDLKFSAIKSGFNLLNIHQEDTKQYFSSGIEALKSFKMIGASYSGDIKNIKKLQLKNFNNFCLENFTNNNRIEISWTIDYYILYK